MHKGQIVAIVFSCDGTHLVGPALQGRCTCMDPDGPDFDPLCLVCEANRIVNRLVRISQVQWLPSLMQEESHHG